MPSFEQLWEKAGKAMDDLDAGLQRKYPPGKRILMKWNCRGSTIAGTIMGARGGHISFRTDSGYVHRRHFRDVVSLVDG